ncbi:hypothetical protein KC887_01965 [Candidatus Kaiserbacteria bacterium]|nr:hypothetical protein [Candidatus Kaiserbacteria bacterium]
MTKVLAELFLILMKVFVKEQHKRERKQHENKVETIRDDPFAEWNRRFGRVRDRTPARELPADDTQPTPSDPPRRSAFPD